MTIKQHGGVFGRNPSFNNVSVETLSIAGTALASTADELNILDGVTADATEINYLDGANTSAVVASKAVLANASGNIAFPDGKGIDFSATSGTGTSELFDDYEEGTWTPVITPGTGGTITTASATGVYTKIGRQVTVNFKVTITDAGTGTGATIIDLPFTQGNYSNGSAGSGREDGATGSMLQVYGYPNQAFIYIALFNNNPTVITGFVLQGSYTYFV